MPRYNKSSNPSAINNSNSLQYSDNFALATRITNMAGPRATGVRSKASTNLLGPTFQSGGSITGQQWTLSAYGRSITGSTVSVGLILQFVGSGGATIGNLIPGATVALPASSSDNPGRPFVTATAPANATGVRLRTTNPSGVYDLSAILYEQGALDSYFDGDSVNASWDGTAGNSASTLADAPILYPASFLPFF